MRSSQGSQIPLRDKRKKKKTKYPRQGSYLQSYTTRYYYIHTHKVKGIESSILTISPRLSPNSGGIKQYICV